MDDFPSTSKQEERRDGGRLTISRLSSNRSDAEVNTPSSSKSLPDYARRHAPSSLDRKTPSKTVTFVSDDNTIEPVMTKTKSRKQNIFEGPAIVTISEEMDKSFHSYETSV